MPIFQHQFSLTKTYWRDRFILINLAISLILNASLWFFLFQQAINLFELKPLHYNIYFGIDLFGQWYRIFLLPLIGLIFYLINSAIGLVIFQKEKIFSYFLIGTSSFVQLILIIAAIFIVYVNL
ncbi:MAG: hypothetical protein A2729_04555 [Candidatus Buchananbacteria bacterium RIFCSPHIGHO2_01_FULL_39_14]|uniref:Uncharacterized protein n=2 Tax=Candidatus Buchananiibacteriota TaxID=1817903 RepID=A0A1G1YPU1_9BACT|nr:MAG: hypothetical protein A2729_04555 [Candidatus Buchananbacteria bacterium RIFCSPHIGHO2_01_FULL_39_14]OGY49265.1 MAG: hypothetical protein A3D39_03150 [Candidatus Buchananbacteria bacterium RIFCSPHIGHO2_02_FULL_39_17]OGY54321.1 MAG: hypothetical protein A2912_04780 [Candidatus Buchananbacteria bacterium RIFCSPLOWO2_01_FULL_40_23b]